MKTCKTSIIESISTKPIQQTQQKYPNHIRTSYFQISTKTQKIKKSKAINVKYFEKNGKPTPFLEV